MGSVGRSWWYEKVKSGAAPAPAFRGPRCTRWLRSEVVSFWEKYPETKNGDAKGGDVGGQP